MNTEEVLLTHLEKYINQTLVHNEIGVYFIKELVSRIRSMKIEIFSNDHNPPHYHVKSNDLTINAIFRIDNCELIQGTIARDDKKRIEAFFSDPKTQLLMKDMWNKSKIDAKKVK